MKLISFGSLFRQLLRQLFLPASALLVLAADCVAEVKPFNEKPVPETREDLISIQQALVESLAEVREATVGIKLGKGFGSGVIVSPEGLILTAAHVTSGVEKELTVVMNDGKEYKAISMGLISTSDAAMMKIVDEGTFPYVEVNKNNDYKLGHWVFALGHSGGFDQARGPVVRLGRIVQDKESTLQTDCKVIGGDSGGPLFDMEGRLIGIHSRVGQETVVENMHVPMREYLSHWGELESNEFVGDGPFAKRPVKGSGYLGIGTEETELGLQVKKLAEDGPAAKAGLQIDDLIVEIDGSSIKNKKDLKAELKDASEGDELEVKIIRNKEEKTLKIVLGKK